VTPGAYVLRRIESNKTKGTILDDDYFPRRRLDDDCASPKHEVFTEEYPSLVRALGGIVLRYAIPALVGRV
jgi:hypothetical protein